MNRFTSDTIFGALFLVSMITAFWLDQENYLIAGLLVASVVIAIRAGQNPEWTIPLLFIGEICSIAAGYVLFWLFIPIQCATIGFILGKMDLLIGHVEVSCLLILFGVIGLVTFGVDQINHMIIPVTLLITGCGFFLIYAIIHEFRLRKQYTGDLS